MKALRKLTAGPGLELVDLPEPEVGPDDVKIRVERTGICGTDLHIDAWDAWAASAIKAPLTPGHEFSGRIVELGSSVKSLSVGDHVSGEGHIVCGVCRNCRAGRRQLCIRTVGVGVNRDGAFAEYVVIPASNVWVHHGEVDPDVAAIFDPFGNAVHVALSFPLVGEDVLITGAGPIGLMAAEVARFAGARYIAITDVNDERLDLARKMGVDIGINVSREAIADAQKTLGMTEGFDIGFEMSGHASALPDIISNLTHGGRVAVLGLPTQPIALDWAKVVTHMITIKGIYGREMYESWYAMSAMLQKGLDIAPVITDRFPASKWQQAFATARSGRGGKVVMDWS